MEMVGTTVESLKLEVGELETARTKEQERADHAQQLLTNARNQLIQVLLFKCFIANHMLKITTIAAMSDARHY